MSAHNAADTGNRGGNGRFLQQAFGVSGPLLDVGPVPTRTATNRPARAGEVGVPCAPSVHGGSADVEAFGYLDGSNGITGHEGSVGKVLTPVEGCRHNTYMTNTEPTKTVAAGRTDFTVIELPRYKGRFTAYVGPNPDGSSTCIPIECKHLHLTFEEARTCADRLARKVERHPEQFPEIARELAR